MSLGCIANLSSLIIHRRQPCSHCFWIRIEKNERKFNEKNALATCDKFYIKHNWKFQTNPYNSMLLNVDTFTEIPTKTIRRVSKRQSVRIVENGTLLSSLAFVCINFIANEQYAIDCKRKVGSQSIRKLYTKSKCDNFIHFSCILF